MRIDGASGNSLKFVLQAALKWENAIYCQNKDVELPVRSILNVDIEECIEYIPFIGFISASLDGIQAGERSGSILSEFNLDYNRKEKPNLLKRMWGSYDILTVYYGSLAENSSFAGEICIERQSKLYHANLDIEYGDIGGVPLGMPISFDPFLDVEGYR